MDLVGATLRNPEKSVKESCAKARYWLSVGSTECVRLQFQPTSEWASQERYKRGPGFDWIQARTLLCLKDGAVPPAAIGSPRTGSPAGPSSSSVTATAVEHCSPTADAASMTRRHAWRAVSFSDKWRYSVNTSWRSVHFLCASWNYNEYPLRSVVLNAEEWTHERTRTICTG